MSRTFLLLAMIFCHVVDDYYLQGWLASAKQRKWWEDNAPDEMYKRDYIMALAMHSMSWSFMTLLPIAVSNCLNVGFEFFAVFIVNALLHGIVDDLKANKRKINLITDQSIHLMQVVFTWILLA